MVYCFFEQSGTFKNEFIKLGIPAEDYDIQNEFKQTNQVCDLFKEIEQAYKECPSIFDKIKNDDLIMAFFPCIYFSCLSQMSMSWGCINYRKKTIKETTDIILERSKKRERFYQYAVKMLAVAKIRGLRLIMENPWAEQTFLKGNFVQPPSLIDIDRTRRGDSFTKPTAYWYINCEPTYGKTYEQPKEHKTKMKTPGSKKVGICSVERSKITPAYARNFICDFILGKKQYNTILTLF